MDASDPTSATKAAGPTRRGHPQGRKRSLRLAALFDAIFPLLAAAGVLFVLVTIGGKAEEGYQLRQEATALQQHINQLQKDNRQLSQKLDYYKSDQYIEKVAREELGLMRPGEIPVIVVPADGTPQPSLVALPTPTPAPTPVVPPSPTWRRWLSVFVDQQ